MSTEQGVTEETALHCTMYTTKLIFFQILKQAFRECLDLIICSSFLLDL